MIFKNRAHCLTCVVLGLSLCAATVFSDDQSLVREFRPPLALGEFNLINHFIIPVTRQEGLYPGMNDEFGLRNITDQAFTSPAKPEKIIWELEPAVILPANSDDRRERTNGLQALRRYI